MKLVAVVGALAAGFYAPNIYLQNLADTRRTKIMAAFPDSLDMMLICVESGMSIEMALGRVGQEIATASVELAEEFALTTAELSYLPERRMAYENLARRTNHPGVKAVAMALTQAENTARPLAKRCASWPRKTATCVSPKPKRKPHHCRRNSRCR
jgi:tight adherence protein C